jgi:hypothetical protein
LGIDRPSRARTEAGRDIPTPPGESGVRAGNNMISFDDRGMKMPAGDGQAGPGQRR